MDGATFHSSDGVRRLTLDPVMERAPLTVQPVRVESSMPAGFRQEWLSGSYDQDGETRGFVLMSGVGSPYLILSVDLDDGREVEEIVDMREVLRTWIDSAREAGHHDGQ